MSRNLKKEEKEFIARTGTQIKKTENTTKDQNTGDKADKQICNTCKKLLPVSKFYKRSNKKPEVHCRNCRNKKRDERHRYWKQEFIYKLSEHINIECVKCGYDKSFSALDFHHIKEKNFSIARITRNLSGKNFTDGKVEKILYEILVNCEILCSNCHREHHTKHFMKLKK